MEAVADATGHDIVVVGASAGGVEALRALVSFLPPDLPATVFVVVHLPALGTSVLPKILGRAGPLSAVHAGEAQKIGRSLIYVAPPDCHMRFVDSEVRLDHGPKVNGHRPAVDTMFESAAATFKGRVTGVILSGVLDDGAAGLHAVWAAGGAALVQSPADALYPTMPAAAMEAVDRPFVGTTEELAAEIVALARRAPSSPPSGSEILDPPSRRLVEVERGTTDSPQPGEPTGFTCPECHGALWESRQGTVTKFRCRTGHEYSAEALVLEQSLHVERALWAALRALEEKGAMLRRLSGRLGERASGRQFARKAEVVVQDALVLRDLLERLDQADDVPEERAS